VTQKGGQLSVEKLGKPAQIFRWLGISTLDFWHDLGSARLDVPGSAATTNGLYQTVAERR